METETTDNAAEFLARHGISYSAQFVPFSMSRNAKPGATVRDLWINWRVTFTRAGRAFSTDFQQGIGHLPEHLRSKFGCGPSTMMAQEIELACETGKAPKAMAGYQNWNSTIRLPLAPPTAADVLECLALDSSVLGCAMFEEWADEYGYEKDSRAVEKIYLECRRIAGDMVAVFGHAVMAELRAMEF